MAVPTKIRDNAREADAALAELAAGMSAADGAPPPADAASDPPPPPTATEARGATVVSTTATPPKGSDAAADVALAQQLAAAEQRYATLQGMFNRQQAQTAELNERIELLTNLLANRGAAAPIPDAPATLISEDERKEFGADLIDVAKRAAREEWYPLVTALREELGGIRTTLQQMGATVQTTAAQTAQSARDRFFTDMDRLVPKWKVWNTDKKFIDWLGQPDVFSGYQRAQLMRAAFDQFDAVRVAKFFETFFEPSSGAAPSGANDTQGSVDPATLIAPGNSASPTQPTTPATGKQWTMKEIDKVYSDQMRGKLTPQKFAQLEAEIRRALAEGRINPE